MSAQPAPRPGGDAEDAALVRAIAGGDERALQELFARHAPWLNARLNRRCADPDAVADVLQDTFRGRHAAPGVARPVAEGALPT